MSIAFGILVVLVGSIIKKHDSSNTDTIFWIGVVFSFIILIFITMIVVKISQKNKRDKGLVMDAPTIAILLIAIATTAVLFYSVNKLSKV